MSPKNRNTILLLILSTLTLIYWQKIISIETDFEQFYLFISSSLIFISAVFISKKLKLSSDQKMILNAIIGIVVIAILLISWNWIFRWYCDTNDFKGNIFRGILYGFRAPFYNRLNLKIKLNNYYPALITSGLFIAYILIFYERTNMRLQRPLLLLFSFFLFISFNWNHTIYKTFTALTCHYDTFSEGLSFFPHWANFLSTYTDQMHLLGAHNNHYPPGNLMLLKLNNELYPYLVKKAVIFAPILSLLPLIGILKQLGAERKAINRYIAFYISSIALLFFPGTSLTPILVLLASSSLFFLLKAIQSRSILNGVLSGLFFAFYAFFSFSFIFFAFFSAIILLLFLRFRFLKIGPLLISLLSVILSFLIIYSIVFTLFDFNIYSCLNTAIHNENLQMKSSFFENISRYLIVSSGNLLAYLGFFGPIIIAFIALYFSSKKKEKDNRIHLIIRSVLITILILSFSNQFFLEIERIWIFLSPFMLFIVIPNVFENNKNESYMRILIASNMIISLLYIISINNCT